MLKGEELLWAVPTFPQRPTACKIVCGISFTPIPINCDWIHTRWLLSASLKEVVASVP